MLCHSTCRDTIHDMSRLPTEVHRHYTVAEYLAFEHEATERHEYRDGEIISMAGGSPQHSLIIANVIGGLHGRLKGKPCRVFESNLRVRSARDARYVYPDVSVVCNEARFDPADDKKTTIINPRVIVEVLSPSTEASDRGEKFQRYIMVDGFEEYVLVAQNQARIETFLRQPDGTWSLAFFEGMQAVARIRSLGVDLPLADIYAGVEFPPPAPPEAETPT